MRENDITLMGEQERSYWWHISCRLVWRSVLSRWLPRLANRQIVDVGCGTGINLQLLKEFGRVVGIDQSPVALNYAKQYGEIRSGDALNLPYADSSVDLVTAMDLIEHLADDEAAVAEWARVLRPGGYLLISTPAYQWLYGPRDRLFMHYRRYNIAGLHRLLSAAHCRPVFSTYFFFFTFPLFVFQRLINRITNRASNYTPVPSPINQLLIGLGQLESAWLRYLPLPFGSSVLVLAKKL